VISLSGFSKTYYSGLRHLPVKAVQDVSFKAGQGKITGLLGLNGAGKTTIIRAICGLHYATTGHVLIGSDQGPLIDAAENPVVVKNLTGYVPEQPVFYDDFTIREFLETTASMHGLCGIERKNAVDRVVAICSLEDVLGKKISELSKGLLQRVSFAQALIHDPPVLVLDEPASGLDPAQIHQMHQFLKTLSPDKTILLSTHIMQEASTLCSDICIISCGRLVTAGSVTDITDSGQKSLESVFLEVAGSPVNYNEM
jgi:ABC-2 type transport system ATP-binding protein